METTRLGASRTSIALGSHSFEGELKPNLASMYLSRRYTPARLETQT